MDLYTYDLDSLVDMSTKIVEGKLVGQHRTNNFDVWEIEVTEPHVGGFAVGQKIDVTALDFYCVGIWGSYKLKKGDQLFLFLDRAKSTFTYNVPDNAEIYWPAPSGVRFISAEKAVGFWQESNPGPYVADVDNARTNSNVPSVTQFRRQIQESIKQVEQWNQILKAKPSDVDIPVILDLLRQREGKTKSFMERDHILETACAKLAELHNYGSILEASLLVPGSYFADATLGHGLATAAGRKFLCDKLCDTAQPDTNRIKWAGLVNDVAGMTGPASFYYSPKFDQGRTNVNEHFLTRIAELASAPQTEVNLQTRLLGQLQYLAGVSGSDLEITDDGKDAEAIIKNAWQKAESQESQYTTERILRSLARIETNSELGPITAILKPWESKRTGRSIGYDLEYQTYEEGSWNIRVVFMNTQTGKTENQNISLEQIKGPAQGSSSDITSVPPNLVPGHYRIYVDFLKGGKVVASSHYFETDL